MIQSNRPDDSRFPRRDAEDLPPSDAPRDDAEREILAALQGLQFGEVTITVREGKVVQIERITRRRQTISRPDTDKK